MRTNKIVRNTAETQISCEINVDGSGENNISTGIGFLDHMLTLFCVHGFFNMNIQATGDTNVDSHHTVEDVGIVVGKAFCEAIGDKKGIKRYGNFVLPMDETLCLVALDLSGRVFLKYDVIFSCEKLGEMQSEMVREFFQAFSQHCPMNLHIKIVDPKNNNNHHVAEAVFKAFAKALDNATQIEPRLQNAVFSSKKALE